MKVHVVSESIGDETILRVFVDALVGEPTDSHAESVKRGRHGLTSFGARYQRPYARRTTPARAGW